MTAATMDARPRTTHAENNGAQHNGAQHNGAQHNGVAAIDAGPARITQTAAAGVSQTSSVADDIVASLSRELTMIVRSVVRLAHDLSGRVAGEFGKVVGLNVEDAQQADLSFSDPTAWV